MGQFRSRISRILSSGWGGGRWKMKLENELRLNSEDLQGGLRSSDFILQAVGSVRGGARGDLAKEVCRQP